MIDIQVAEGCLVTLNPLADPTPGIGKITVDHGTLVIAGNDGRTLIVAQGEWEQIEIEPDPDYVSPVVEIPGDGLEEVGPADPRPEPEEGWFSAEEVVAYDHAREQWDDGEGETLVNLLRAWGFDAERRVGEDEWAVIERISARYPTPSAD